MRGNKDKSVVSAEPKHLAGKVMRFCTREQREHDDDLIAAQAFDVSRRTGRGKCRDRERS